MSDEWDKMQRDKEKFAKQVLIVSGIVIGGALIARILYDYFIK